MEKIACSSTNRLSKATLLAMLDDSVCELLNRSIWEIISFNNQTKVVCVELFTDYGTRIISLTLPEI
jgi:hypothetical protein